MPGSLTVFVGVLVCVFHHLVNLQFVFPPLFKPVEQSCSTHALYFELNCDPQK